MKMKIIFSRYFFLLLFVTQSALALYIASQQFDKNAEEYIVLQEESDVDDSESFDDIFSINDLLVNNINPSDHKAHVSEAQKSETAYFKLHQNPHEGYSQTSYSPPDNRI
jgi:hypothetical protein